MVRLLLLVLLGCAAEDPCPEVAMTDGPAGIVVTEDEHPAAWGEPGCFGCHAQPVLHKTGCTPDVDLDALQARVAAEGLDSCAVCHGSMGVTP